MPDITTEFANEGIRQADRMIDELDEFMKKLENAGILSGWSQFMKEEDTGGQRSGNDCRRMECCCHTDGANSRKLR